MSHEPRGGVPGMLTREDQVTKLPPALWHGGQGQSPGGGGAWPTGAEVSFRSRVQSDTGAAATATAVSQ